MQNSSLNLIILLSLLPFLSIISQENNLSIKEKKIFAPQASLYQIKFNNSAGFTLGSISDESDSRGQKFGSLYLSPAQFNTTNTMDNKLWINYRGDLMFGDSPLGGWWTWSGSVLTFPTGYMVIGNTLTQAANTNVLTVLGRATFKSIKIADGNEGDGKVLVSDADGIGSWQTFSSGGSIDELFDGKSIEGSGSVYLGLNAGYDDNRTSGGFNVGVGFHALDELGSSAVGRNTAVGSYAMKSFEIGSDNVAVGYESLKGGDDLADGDENTAVGSQAMYNFDTGNKNTAIGYQALYGGSGSTSGEENVAIGNGALHSNTTGSGNVAIGFEAGYDETGSDKLYIHNGRSTSPLIYGDFQFADLLINGSLEVTQGITGTVSPPSDLRFKKNIMPINNAIDLIGNLKGVRYDWKRNEFPDKNFPDKLQIGLIAQEVEKVLPEVVNTRRDGYKGVEYSKLTAVLINAIQEQQEMIEELRYEIEELKRSKRFTYSKN